MIQCDQTSVLSPSKNERDNQQTPKFDMSQASETLAEKRLDRAAEESADKAERTERRYDQDHSIFSK
jgi:hypothetical protein